METNNKNQPAYISLAQASKTSPYSQEYLSLRARQGKLKATKIGNTWVTTHEWLDEYLGRAARLQQAGPAFTTRKFSVASVTLILLLAVLSPIIISQAPAIVRDSKRAVLTFVRPESGPGEQAVQGVAIGEPQEPGGQKDSVPLSTRITATVGETIDSFDLYRRSVEEAFENEALLDRNARSTTSQFVREARERLALLERSGVGGGPAQLLDLDPLRAVSLVVQNTTGVGGDLTVDEDAAIDGMLTVTGSATLSSSLQVGGAATLATTTVTGTLTQSGGLASFSNVDVAGTILSGSSNIAITTSAGFLDADALQLISGDGAGAISSGSGLEVDADRLGLIQGCSPDQLLKWNDVTNVWSCAFDVGAAGASLQGAYDAGNTITTTTARDIAITLADTTTDSNFILTIASGSTSTTSITRADGGVGEAAPAQLLVLDNADANVGIADGLRVQAAAGGMTDAIDASDPELVNAINIGANDILSNGTSISSAELNLLDGHDVALVDTNDAVSTAITGTGALGSGSITVGFGSIDVGADAITTTGTITGGTVNATSNVQTGGTNRIDSTGNLVNIGNLTATAAITIASTGAGNDITLNSADTIELLDNTNLTGNFDVSGTIQAGSSNITITTAAGNIDADAIVLITGDGAGATSSGSGLETDTDRLGLLQGCLDNEILKWNNTTNVWFCTTDAGGGGTLQAAYDGGNLINTSDARDFDIELADDTTDSNLDIDIFADNTVSISRLDNASAEAPAQLLLLENLDVNLTIADGLLVNVAAGGVITDGLDVSDPEIVNALNIGDNTIAGGLALIDFTNFDVTGAGAVTAGSTITGTTLNATTGTLQTNSTTRVDNSGNLVNIGNITGTGAITIASTGAGNDVIINGVDAFDVQDPTTFASTAIFNGLATFNTDVDLTLLETENLTLTNTVTGTNAVDLVSATLTNNTTSGSQNAQAVSIGGSGTTETGITINYTGTVAGGLTSGLTIAGTSTGTIATGITLTDAEIGTGIDLGVNDIVGTSASINFADFDVASTGQVTISDTTDITSPAAEDLTLTAGTTGVIELNDTVRIPTLDGTTGATTLCRNASNLLATCSANPSGVTLDQAYQAGNTISVVAAEGALGVDLVSANFDIEVGQGTDTGDFRIWDGTANWLFIDESADTLALGAAAGASITIGGSGITTTNAGALAVSEGFTANGLSTFNTDVDLALAETENFSMTNTVTGTNAVDLISTVLTNNTTSGTQNAAVLSVGGSGTTETGVTINYTGTVASGLTSGLTIAGTSTGTIATAINLTDAEIGTGIDLGVNDIVGTSAVINFSDFDVASTGQVTVSDTTDLTTPSGEDLTIVAAGAGVIDLNDTVRIPTLDGTAGSTSLCRNASTLLAICSANPSGVTLDQAYVGGNTISVVSAEGALGVDLVSANFDIEVGQGTDTGDFRIWDGSVNWFFIDESADTLALGAAAGAGITLGGTSITTTNAGALVVSEGLTANGLSTFNTDVDLTLLETENLTLTNTLTGSNAVDLISPTLTNNSTSGTQRAEVISVGGSGTTESGLTINYTGTVATGLTAGMIIAGTSTGTIATAVDVADAEINTALSFGANDITGTNFTVTGSSGNVDTQGTIQAGSSNVTITTAAGNIDADALGLITGDGAGGSSSGSGLETDTDRLGLLQGCTDAQVLKWVDASNIWQCSADAGAAGASLQGAYDAGNSITTSDVRDIDFILSDNTTDSNFDIDIVADNTVSISRTDNASTEVPPQLLLLENLDVNLTITDGLLFNVATGGVITDAIDASDPDIVNAINIGANDILSNGTSISSVELNRLDGKDAPLVDENDLTSGDGAGGTSSGSGMEAGTGGIGLLQGCANNEVLKWNDSSSVWACGSSNYSKFTSVAYTNVLNTTGNTVDVAATDVDVTTQTAADATQVLLGYDLVFTVQTSGDAWQAHVMPNGTAQSADNIIGLIEDNDQIASPFVDDGGIVIVSLDAGQVFDYSLDELIDGGTVTFRLGVLGYWSPVTTGADLAENYYTKDRSIHPGDVVSLDPTFASGVVKSTGAYDRNAIGIVSTKPGLVLDDVYDPSRGVQVLPDGYKDRIPVAVALSGRVPVNVSTENGPIKAGDFLTASSIPGVAMKATKAGRILGQALFDYNYPEIGAVMAFVNNSYSSGVNLAEVFPGLVEEGSDGNDNQFAQTVLTQLIANSQMVEPVESSFLSDILTDRLVAGLEVITPKLSAETATLDTIKILTTQLTMDLGEDGSLVIKGKDGETAASIDAAGNAIFKGTLTADKIEAKDIVGLELSNEVPSGPTPGDATTTSEVEDIPAPLDLSDIILGKATVTLDLAVIGKLEAAGGLVIGGPAEFKEATVFQKLATFFDRVVFNKDVEFAGRPTFNKDTAGFATILAGQTEVEVTFTRAYESPPVITASPAFNSDTGAAEAEAQFLASDIRYLISQRNTHGFTILLNKPAESDLMFSWVALSVKENQTASQPPVAQP